VGADADGDGGAAAVVPPPNVRLNLT